MTPLLLEDVVKAYHIINDTPMHNYLSKVTTVLL